MAFRHQSQIIKTFRVKRGMSQAALAQVLGASSQVISNIERAKCGVPFKNIRGLSKALKINKVKIIGAVMSDFYSKILKEVNS